MDAGSLAEIDETRAQAEAWLAAQPDDEAVTAAVERLSALEEALRAVGLSELPPSTGAR
jgi:aryl-alcohol dehydrogenase-like predicted oxidoreductase